MLDRGSCAGKDIHVAHMIVLLLCALLHLYVAPAPPSTHCKVDQGCSADSHRGYSVHGAFTTVGPLQGRSAIILYHA